MVSWSEMPFRAPGHVFYNRLQKIHASLPDFDGFAGRAVSPPFPTRHRMGAPSVPPGIGIFNGCNLVGYFDGHRL